MIRKNNMPHYMIITLFILSLLKEINLIISVYPLIGPMLWGTSLIFLCLNIIFIRIKLNRNQLLLLLLVTCLNFFLLLSVLTYSSFSAMVETFLLIIPNYAIFTLVISLENVRKTFNSLSKIIITFTSILSVYGIILKYLGQIVFIEGKYIIEYKFLGVLFTQKIVGYEQGEIRISSLTSNPNTLAWFILITSLLIVYRLFLVKKLDILLSALLIINLYTLILTSSRTSLISFIIGLFIFLFFYIKRKSFIYISTASIVLLLLILPKIFESSVIRSGDGLSSRTIIWGEILKSVDKRIFYGIGLGNNNSMILDGFATSTHNAYLSILSEVGIIGLLLFCLIWFLGIYNAGYELLKTNNKDPLYIVIISILLCLLVHQFFEVQLLKYNFLSFYWWYLIVVSVTLNTDEEVLYEKR